MKKVALIVDHPSRDLDYISDIGFHLVKDGIKTFIVPSNMRHRELLLLKPDYILYPNHRDTTDSEISILEKANISIGVLETEQCVNDIFFEKYQLPKKLSSRNDIEDFFVWGEYFLKLCIDRNWYSNKQVKVIGSPKHDRYFSSQKLGSNKIYDLLIATSFPNSNPLFGESVNRKTYQNLGMKNSEIDEFINLHKVNVQNMIQFINKNLSNTKLNILLRVHPYEENFEFYKNSIKGTNIEIDDGRNTIYESLNKSKILIHFNSTSCLDAQALGIPSINMSWMPQLEVFHESTEVMSLVSYLPETESECMQLISSILNKKIELKIQNDSQELEEYIFKFDGLASIRCAEIIKNSLNSKNKEVNFNLNQKTFLENFNLRNLIISSILKNRWKNSRKYFNKRLVEQSLKRSGKIINSKYAKVGWIDLSSVELLE